jgi:hypothetical protein
MKTAFSGTRTHQGPCGTGVRRLNSNGCCIQETVDSGVAGLFDLCPVAHEAFKPLIGQGVTHQLAEGFGGHGGRVGAQLDALQHVSGMTDGGGEHLGVQVVVRPGVHDLRNQFHAVVTGVVDASDERGNVGGAGFGGHQRLRGRENQGHVGVNAVLGEDLGGGQPLGSARDFDDDVVGQFGLQRPTLLNHAFGVHRRHFGGNGARADAGNLANNFLEVAAGFLDEGRVGGHAVKDAPSSDFSYLIDVSGVKEELHAPTR